MLELQILWDNGPFIKVLIWRYLNAYLISLLKLMALNLLNFFIVDNKQEAKFAALMNKQDEDRLNDEFLEFVSM